MKNYQNDLTNAMMKAVRDDKVEEIISMLTNGANFDIYGDTGINAIIHYSLTLSSFSMNHITRILLASPYTSNLKANIIIGLLNISQLSMSEIDLIKDAISKIHEDELSKLKNKIYTNSREIVYNSKAIDVNVHDLEDINFMNVKALSDINPILIYVDCYREKNTRNYLMSLLNSKYSIDFLDMFYYLEGQCWIIKKPNESYGLKCSQFNKVTKSDIERLLKIGNPLLESKNNKELSEVNRLNNSSLISSNKNMPEANKEDNIANVLKINSEEAKKFFKETLKSISKVKEEDVTMNKMNAETKIDKEHNYQPLGNSNYSLVSISACATIQNEDSMDVQHINIQASSVKELETKIESSIIELNDKNDKKVLSTVEELFKNNQEFKNGLLKLIKDMEIK